MTGELYDVVILAGGLATRLRPLTEHIPKSLINIHGEPFIAHQLRLLKKQGIQRVIICTGYLGEMIEKYVGNGDRFQLQIDYSFDGNLLLGTAGAIKNALPKLPEKFFILYGDSFLTCNYQDVQHAFNRQNKPALMTIFHNQDQWDKSNIEFHDNEIVSYDKKNQTPAMTYIDYGLAILKKSLFNSATPSDLADLYQALLQEKRLAAFPVNERFYEIGSLTGIVQLEHHLKCIS